MISRAFLAWCALLVAGLAAQRLAGGQSRQYPHFHLVLIIVTNFSQVPWLITLYGISEAPRLRWTVLSLHQV